MILRILLIGTLSFATIFAITNCASAPRQIQANTGPYASPQPDTGKTLANLLEAYNGESNANAKYLEYAKKADQEGYGKVASLFRAAARAEAVHIANHAEVIRKMGANPQAEIKLPEIKSTVENLRDSLAGETYERDTMYTDFLTEARRVGNKDAMRTFNLAKTAEAEHARLYAEAIANLDKWKIEKTTFYVCPVCGYTTTDPNLAKCPVDFTAKEKFEAIS